MKIKRFKLFREYDIICKAFLPDRLPPKNVILGVHGFAGDKESSMLEILAEECSDNTALICFDFPAHGESPVNENYLTVTNCKLDLLSVSKYVTEFFPNANKSIFATSFGGFISLQCYEKLADFTFVLRAPAIAMPEILLNSVLKITADEFEDLNCVKCGFERGINLPYSFYGSLLAEENLFSKCYSKPMLVMHGDCDDIVPLSIVQRFAAKNPNAQLKIIEGADHRFKKRGETEIIVSLTRSFLNI